VNADDFLRAEGAQESDIYLRSSAFICGSTPLLSSLRLCG